MARTYEGTVFEWLEIVIEIQFKISFMKKSILFVFLLSFIFVKAQRGFALVELFTSEGSDTGPVGEEIVNRVVDQFNNEGQEVILLQYHVDYWNNRGWKDPYSKFQFTRRQENYSRVLAEKELYTPEVVVNGTKSFSGTKEITVKNEIQNALSIPVSYNLVVTKDTITNDTLYLSYNAPLENNNAVFRVVITQNNLKSSVTSGENSGKNLTHNHVVRILYSFDGIKKNQRVKVPLNIFKIDSSCSIYGIVQSKQSMKILAVTKIKK